MADARNESKWNSRVSRSELLSGEPIGLGSRVRVVNGRSRVRRDRFLYEHPRRVAFDVTGKHMDLTGSFTFAADSEGTMLAEFDFRPKGVIKLVFPLMTPLVRRDLRRQLASFRLFCEDS